MMAKRTVRQRVRSGGSLGATTKHSSRGGGRRKGNGK